ncbi:protein translocase subunit SecD [Streptomyces albidoflavus]|uniref:protein translocase subunit SecD n=1 Tax=Streptomyces albidoflavus TaxID=1886 RepID=UPI0033BB44EC
MSRRATAWRALIAFAVVAVSLFLALTTPARLGLDLSGGTRIVLQAQEAQGRTPDAESTDRALEVLRQRVDALGVAEPQLVRSGSDRIVVELPGVQDPREAAEVIGRTAQLTFHPVTGEAQKAAPAAEDGSRALADPDRPDAFLELGPPALTGEGVSDARPDFDATSGEGWAVALSFEKKAAGAWAKLTGEAACAAPGDPGRRVAIVLDDRVVSAPGMRETVPCGAGITGGSTQITGGFDAEGARELAALVKGGALPLPVEVVEQSTVGPSLGADAIRAGAWAALIGLACTAVFITAVYRLLGLLATVALSLYGLISYAAIVALGATLTMPGIAGFVLAVGMAVDANVLVFERAREEYGQASRRPKDLRRPLARGFAKAWSAVLDSNVTTLIAAGLLFALATGPVKGFGVTLAVGVLASMVSALVITRVLADWALGRGLVRRRPQATGMAGKGRLRTRLEQRPPRLMRSGGRWLLLSGGLLLVALAGVGVRGLELGVEFTGGRQTQYATERPVDAETARAAVSSAGFPEAVVQRADQDGASLVTVRTGPLEDAEERRVRAALAEHGGEVTVERDDLVGPSLGAELRDKAVLALAVAVGAQLLYLTVRFRGTLALAAVVAMVQDVLLVVGLFAWLGKPVDSVFLAALLTVVGYSVNDTVVVFDRLRELRRARPGAPWETLGDLAVGQTLPRTVNTGLGAVFVLLALALSGGGPLTDFAVALLAGITVGIASTIFTAMPLAVRLERRRGPAASPDRPRKPVREGTGAVV